MKLFWNYYEIMVSVLKLSNYQSIKQIKMNDVIETIFMAIELNIHLEQT